MQRDHVPHSLRLHLLGKDLEREVQGAVEVDQLGIFENIKNVITIVEWPEKIKKIIENRLEITFSYEVDDENRNLKFDGFGKWKNFKINEI